MKISKTTRWILTIGIFAILLVGAGVVYGRQMAEQSQLSLEIAQAPRDFPEYAEQKKDLEARLSQANSRIASAQSEFCQCTESIEINEALFEAAHDANVTITKLSSSPPVDEELNGITYRVLLLNIVAEGEVLPELLRFSMKVSEKFSTATIESAKINVPPAPEEGTSEEKPTIDLQVKIYAYEVE